MADIVPEAEEKYIDKVTAKERPEDPNWGLMTNGGGKAFEALPSDLRLCLFRLIRSRDCEKMLWEALWERWTCVLEPLVFLLSKDTTKIVLDFLVSRATKEEPLEYIKRTGEGIWEKHTMPNTSIVCNVWCQGACDRKPCSRACRMKSSTTAPNWQWLTA